MRGGVFSGYARLFSSGIGKSDRQELEGEGRLYGLRGIETESRCVIGNSYMLPVVLLTVIRGWPFSQENRLYRDGYRQR